MFPGFRLLVAAVVASITTLIFGFGLFAAVRVSQAPFTRIPYAASPTLSADRVAMRRVTAAEPFAIDQQHGERGGTGAAVPVMAYAEPTVAERIDAAMKALPASEDRPPISINQLFGDLTATADRSLAVAPSAPAPVEPPHAALTFAELPHDASPPSPHLPDSAALHLAAAPPYGEQGGDIPAAPAPVRVVAPPAPAPPQGRIVVRFVNGARADGIGDNADRSFGAQSQYGAGSDRQGWGQQPAATPPRGRYTARQGSDADAETSFGAYGH